MYIKRGLAVTLLMALVSVTGCSEGDESVNIDRPFYDEAPWEAEGNSSVDANATVLDINASSAPYVAQTPESVDIYDAAAKDNSFSTASSISVGTLQSRSLYPLGDVDVVSVTLTVGEVYEFSVNNLETTADSIMSLYDENRTFLQRGDDYIDFDSNIKSFTAPYTGTYYIRPRTLENDGGLMSYQLGVRKFVDADGDGYSPFYDCNDQDPTINPFAIDVGGNGVDENCDGIDAIGDTVADASEVDNTMATAKAIPETYGSVWEIQNRQDIQSKMHTIHQAGEVDYIKITLSPYSSGELVVLGQGTLSQKDQYSYEILDVNGTTVASDVNFTFKDFVNPTGVAQTHFLKVYATDGTSTGGFVPAYVSYGVDMDGDGYYTKNSDEYDCDDTNASIHIGAVDLLGDQVDANCNGADD